MSLGFGRDWTDADVGNGSRARLRAHTCNKKSVFIKFLKGGGVFSVYKNLCCKFCIVQEAFLQQKLTQTSLFEIRVVAKAVRV